MVFKKNKISLSKIFYINFFQLVTLTLSSSFLVFKVFVMFFELLFFVLISVSLKLSLINDMCHMLFRELNFGLFIGFLLQLIFNILDTMRFLKRIFER